MLLVASFYRKLKPKFVKTIKKDTDMNKYKVIIQGMSCNHCVMNVKNTIAKLDGVKNVEVVLAEKGRHYVDVVAFYLGDGYRKVAVASEIIEDSRLGGSLYLFFDGFSSF
jgi:copper chaperone CopZ